MSRAHRYSRWQLVWRALLAAPFVLSLGLTLVLGPATLNGKFASYALLAVLSVVTALLMFGVTVRMLFPVGVITFIGFPVLAGLGFSSAPGWAQPITAIIFYGSMLASLGAAVTGLIVITRSLLRAHPRLLAMAGASVVLLIAVVIVSVSTPSEENGRAYANAMAMNMGSVINTGLREAEPTFTADGRTMFFNCNNYDICVSRRMGQWENARWTRPQLLGSPISTAFVEVEPWIDTTGDKLYFQSSRPFGHGDGPSGLSLYVEAIGQITMKLGVSPFGGLGQDDIWVSELDHGVWSEPRNLSTLPGEPPVNTKFADHCLSFSADGKEAFWTSNRPGGFGNNDIWTSRLVNGQWTQPENLGPNVNGPGSDHHSIPSLDGRSLYVTSDRTGGHGGHDMYVTTRGAEGTWSELVNAGPKVNGPGDDRCTAFTPDGRILLFDSDRDDGYGKKDIWWVYVEDVLGSSVHR